MTATLSPADEACTALVNRLNSMTTFVLDVEAKYSRLEIDQLEQVEGLRVDVVANTEQGQSDRLDGLDETIHEIRVYIRKHLTTDQDVEIQELALLRTQIIAALDNWDSADRRVRVWDSENEALEQPMKEQLRTLGMFMAVIVLTVKVEP